MPKQFQRIGAEPMLMHTMRAFYAYDYRMRIVLVIPEGYSPLWNTLCNECHFTTPHTVVHGGETRFHSVQNGLRKISDEETVGIHDGARPFVTPTLIGRCFDTSFELGVGIFPVVDEVNARFARVENIRRFVLLEKELDHDDGELTATQKVRRSLINKKFARELDIIYGGA